MNLTQNSITENILGLLAQNVKNVFPELVFEDSIGILSIDYFGLIPVLVESLKEQDKQINEQNEKISNLESRISILESNLINDGTNLNNEGTKKSFLESTTDDINNPNVPSLSQNTPNPFYKKTDISYYLPETASNASIAIYNLNGSLSKSIKITDTGNGKIIIRDSELIPGTYLYTLLINGKEVDTKLMILNE